jgi:hypothetical protein
MYQGELSALIYIYISVFCTVSPNGTYDFSRIKIFTSPLLDQAYALGEWIYTWEESKPEAPRQRRV